MDIRFIQRGLRGKRFKSWEELVYFIRDLSIDQDAKLRIYESLWSAKDITSSDDEKTIYQSLLPCILTLNKKQIFM